MFTLKVFKKNPHTVSTIATHTRKTDTLLWYTKISLPVAADSTAAQCITVYSSWGL